jgi:hypothetical protein
MKTFLYHWILIHVNISEYCSISKAIKIMQNKKSFEENIYCRDVASQTESKLRESLLFLLRKNRRIIVFVWKQ